MLAALAVSGLGAGLARGQTLTPADVVNLSTIFPTKPDPGGAAPYVTATLNTTSDPGYPVELTLTATGLVGTEYISDVWFNFGASSDPSFCPQDLSYRLGTNTTGLTLITGNKMPSKNDPTNDSANYQEKADGDGYYSVDVSFPTGGSSMFTNGTSVQLYMSWSKGTLTPPDFLYSSTMGGGEGTYYLAAHIQNVGGTGVSSSYVGANSYSPIPETPAFALWLGAAALGGIFALRGKRSAGVCAD